MNILAVDSSALTASVAIMSENKIISESSVTSGLTHSETLLPMIDTALKSVNMTASDIDLFAVSNGPGSFTGLRIGVGTVKGLAYAAKKSAVGICTLEALAYNLSTSERLVCPIMDARRGEVYNAVYRFENQIAQEVTAPRAISIEELCGEIKESVVFVGDGVSVYREKITDLLGEKADFAPPNMVLQRAASLAVSASKKQNFCDAASLETIYLRKPQAEREYDERMGLR